MTKLTVDEIQAIARKVLDKQKDALANMPKGELGELSDKIIHRIVGTLAGISKSLEIFKMLPKQEVLLNMRSAANNALGFLGNNFSEYVMELRDQVEQDTGRRFVEDMDIIINAVRFVRNPDEVNEFTEAVRNASPIAELCIDAAKVHKEAAAFANKELGKFPRAELSGAGR